jgi:hypothetical protein
MNGKKAKTLRRKVTGDPDMINRIYYKLENPGTLIVHPHSERGQYKQAKKEGKK